MNMMKISLYNIVSNKNPSKKKIENSHKKNLSYCQINLLQNPNFLHKNKNSPQNKSFISSDYTNSGITLDQTKINSEKNINISKHTQPNFTFLNSKEHKNYMKNFIDNINRTISKKRKKKKYNQKNQNKELNEKENKIINLKPIFKSIKKYSNSNYDKSISEQIMSNLKNIKSTVINNNNNNNTISEKNSSSFLSSSLISHTSIFNSKPSNSISSSISISKKESNNNSEIASYLEEIPLTYSDDNITKRKNIYNNNLIVKKEYNENKINDFVVFCENINKKLFD